MIGLTHETGLIPDFAEFATVQISFTNACDQLSAARDLAYFPNTFKNSIITLRDSLSSIL
jgi:hypothetical protein